VIAESAPAALPAILSGPSFASDVARGLPTAVTLAAGEEATAAELARAFGSAAFRPYHTTDVRGVEIGGAAKNVVALAAGIADGLGYGDNSKAALITRGLVEITRLAVKLGADPLTMAGLAGVGDLVATCMSKQSRNRFVGEELGKGRSLDEIIASMNMVAEGVKSSKSVTALADRHEVDMPIAQRVRRVIHEGADAREMVEELMTRSPEPEFLGIRTEPSG
jgi:glycerol-3-phosphate dehydrogenase (NAD(P)+)